MSETWKKDLPERPDDGRQQGRERTLRWSAQILLLLGTITSLALLPMWVGIYIGRHDPWSSVAAYATEAESAAFLWVAGASLALFSVALVLSIIRARGGLIFASMLLLVFGLVMAFVFEVPRGRFLEEPEPAPHIHHCYDISEANCPAG